jgi:hypothetical protein
VAGGRRGAGPGGGQGLAGAVAGLGTGRSGPDRPAGPGLARLLAGFDDRVLDRGLSVIARGTLALAGAAARADDADVDGLVRRVGAGARRLGQLARRPQTGQLHAYYAQAAVALAVLTLVFILVR